MPTILLLANMIKITINPNDKHRFPHVHVIHAEKSALISLDDFEVLENSGFSENNEHELLMEAWSEYNG